MIFLLECFLQNRRLELFKAAVPSVSSPSYFKINHSPGGNEQYRKMQAVRILPGREICSAVLWLLCKVLFNDTATEGVLYYLSHCSSLQSQHCISTLLFYIYKQQAIPEKFLFQLHNSTEHNCVITSPCWGKSCCCSCRGSLPAALGGSSCTAHRVREVLLPLAANSGSWEQQWGYSHSSASVETPEGRGVGGTLLVLGSQWVQGEPGPIHLSLLMH